jgi:hypothetical protein
MQERVSRSLCYDTSQKSVEGFSTDGYGKTYRYNFATFRSESIKMQIYLKCITTKMMMKWLIKILRISLS